MIQKLSFFILIVMVSYRTSYAEVECRKANVLLALDASSSVTENIPKIQTKAKDLLQALKKIDDEVHKIEAIVFTDKIEHSSDKWTNVPTEGDRPSTLINFFDQLTNTSEGTDLSTVFDYANKKFSGLSKEVKDKTKPILILISDVYGEQGALEKTQELVRERSNLGLDGNPGAANLLLRKKLTEAVTASDDYESSLRLIKSNNIDTIVIPVGNYQLEHVTEITSNYSENISEVITMIKHLKCPNLGTLKEKIKMSFGSKH